ncbi:MAG: polyprenol monophosphomannose synthase [Nitrospiraceae bacterium]|nr:polyprenol monophosphomannose synthase [Nitrospiraceae bacterium]
MPKPLIILPTFNEKDTIAVILLKVLAFESFEVLVIDDNSPDGTAGIVEDWMKNDKRVHLLKRQGKLGLGTAYLAGFRWGLEKGYDCFIEMDSDLSHNPADLPKFVDEIVNGADLVIGSRYVNGKISVVGWDFRRLLLSKFGNIYASRILRMKFSDLTSGFRAYSRRALEKIDLNRIRSGGYAFQIEMAYTVWQAGLGLKEIPIIFTERARGSSKMSKQIVREAVWLPWRLRCSEFIKKPSSGHLLQTGKKF